MGQGGREWWGSGVVVVRGQGWLLSGRWVGQGLGGRQWAVGRVRG